MRSKRSAGTAGEDAVSVYVQQKGMTLITRNFRSPYGEIDLIASDSGVLVFIEVKLRNSGRYGLGREAVTPIKQERYRNGALHYMQLNHCAELPIRFDVAEVNGSRMDIIYIKNAF